MVKKKLHEYKLIYRGDPTPDPAGERRPKIPPPDISFPKETFVQRMATLPSEAFTPAESPRQASDYVPSSSEFIGAQYFQTPEGSEEENAPMLQMKFVEADVLSILRDMGLPNEQTDRALSALRRAFPTYDISDLAGGSTETFLRPFLLKHVGDLIPPKVEELFLANQEDVRSVLEANPQPGFLSRTGPCFFLRSDANSVCGIHGIRFISDVCAVSLYKEKGTKLEDHFHTTILSEVNCPDSRNFFVKWFAEYYEGNHDILWLVVRSAGAIIGGTLLGVAAVSLINVILGALAQSPVEQSTGYDAVKFRSVARKIPGKQVFQPESQGSTEFLQPQVDGRADKIRRNMVKLWVKNPSAKAGCVCFATGVVLRVAMSNSHPFANLEKGAIMSVYGRTSRSVAVIRCTSFSP